MREIWVMQPRLEKRARTAYHLLEHLRFRAGYDFLLLRCEAGEVPAEVGEWWTRFIDADTTEREELLRSLALSGRAAAPNAAAVAVAGRGADRSADRGCRAECRPRAPPPVPASRRARRPGNVA